MLFNQENVLTASSWERQQRRTVITAELLSEQRKIVFSLVQGKRFKMFI